MPKRITFRAWHAIVIALVGVWLTACIFVVKRSPLSPQEARLVGAWSNPPNGVIRSFAPDRTFSTSNGQVVGIWRIDDGRLTLTYWQPWELPHDYDVAGIVHMVRRSRKDTCTWEITYSDDGQQHILVVPADEGRPSGQFTMHRVMR